MRFTLVYDGDLPPNGNAVDKHKIRLELHPQIEELWTHQGLSNIKNVIDPNDPSGGQHLSTVNGFSFATVVHPYFHIRAKLDILMLRSGPPGELVHGGDLDNRLKTLFDAMTRPANPQQLVSGWTPSLDQQPLHCLLDDDRYITAVAVEADRLLGQTSPNSVRLTIRVHLHAVKPAWAHALFLTP
jgi:hypothetical protein